MVINLQKRQASAISDLEAQAPTIKPLRVT